jgi:hypothetical protein
MMASRASSIIDTVSEPVRARLAGDSIGPARRPTPGYPIRHIESRKS